MHRAAGNVEKVQHPQIQLFQWVTRIHNQHQADELAPLLKVVAQEFDPMRTDGFGNLRIAVARQIDHEAAVAQFEEIDVLGSPRRFRNIGEPDMIGQGINRTGFACVTPSDKCDFCGRIGQVFEMVDGGEEFGVLKEVHPYFLAS